MNKLGIIAGNRSLPILVAKYAKKTYPHLKITAICFYGETDKRLIRLVDKHYWVEVGEFKRLIDIIKRENIPSWIMVGQISPYRVFKLYKRDSFLLDFVNSIGDFRPHNLFTKLIERLEKEGVRFLDSTYFIKHQLAEEGVMNNFPISDDLQKDIEFGLNIIKEYRNLDVGQTIVVKNRVVVSLESIEGTDNTIKRGYKVAGRGCLVLKFSKYNQDLRFDVPVVGMDTLRLLKRIKAKGLVLEAERVIIIDKEIFINFAKKWNIPIIGYVL